VSGLIVQNGNAYDEGLREFWNPIKAYWADPSQKNRDALNSLVTLDITKFQYTDGMGDVARISPDNWVHDQALLDRPGNRDIQLDMLGDYRTNVPLYPQFQAFFRERQPPTLIVWGKNDKIFPRPKAPIPICAICPCRGAHPRQRPLRPGRPARRHGPVDPRLPGPQGRPLTRIEAGFDGPPPFAKRYPSHSVERIGLSSF
jgi:hypothetical protein